jgi:hypothetical protein
VPPAAGASLHRTFGGAANNREARAAALGGPAVGAVSRGALMGLADEREGTSGRQFAIGSRCHRQANPLRAVQVRESARAFASPLPRLFWCGGARDPEVAASTRMREAASTLGASAGAGHRAACAAAPRVICAPAPHIPDANARGAMLADRHPLPPAPRPRPPPPCPPLATGLSRIPYPTPWIDWPVPLPRAGQRTHVWQT